MILIEVISTSSLRKLIALLQGKFISNTSAANSLRSIQVVGKSARDNPERYCGWF